jgi:opacity protein-like surface antigen
VFGGYSYLRIDNQGVTGSQLDTECNLISPGLCPPGTFGVHSSFNGWNAAGQVNVDRRFSIKTDLSGHYGTPITLSSDAIAFLNSLGITGLPPKANSFSYLFGPVVSQRFNKYTVFGHAMFGANRVGTNIHVAVNQLQIPAFTISNTGFAMAFGGGVDTRISRHFSFRGQADYLYTRHDVTDLIPTAAGHQNNLRASAGIVYRFGETADSTVGPTRTAVPHSGMTITSLGIVVIPRADETGAQITEVARNSVAEMSGLHPNDIINFVNGSPVKTPMELANLLSSLAPGAKVKLGVLVRGMWQTESNVVLGTPR